ncbi:hypothetical protein F8388_013359 [Cannabis sativa]|uniref:RNase H type-1 domain-containing protein n=1 Tax=Cannabis sativa TaxID=3483 RepID=A0A7J6I5R5_CANSA|nr:hypothetical protein F8388_013359 [Cannabis sativa]KAF4402421.1 hypothetical protein G4B88_012206 [Cannabis sativa]
MLNMLATMDTTDTTMEDLLAKTTNLTVLDEDGWEINMAGGTEVASFCAMGRFCSNRPISRSLLRTILGRVWGIADRNWGVEIKHTIKEASFLVFSFKSSQDLDRILTKNPWFLNNGLLIVERMIEMPTNWDKILTKFPLSGRILNLPTSSITQGNLNRLAGFVGDTIEVQKADLTKIVTKVGSPSMARPELPSSKMINPNTNPTIQGLKTVDKGKAIAMTDPVGQLISEQQVLKGKHNHTQQADLHGISGKLTNTKRSGSWRSEEFNNIFKDHNLFNSQHKNGIQGPAIDSLNIDTESLLDVPITYTTGCDFLSKIEGPTKQRKVIPKRNKNRKGTNSNEAISTDPMIARRKDDAKEISVVQIPAEVTINSLLQPDGNWKENEVRSWFHNDDIPWVLGIKPAINRSDWITWSPSPNGIYSVASGYKLRFQNPNVAECSNKSQIKSWWKFIWGSHLTLKINNFIWRVFNHWIPTKLELAKRGMVIDTHCELCTFQNEDICHALWHCPKVQNIWKLFGFPKLIPLNLKKAADVLWWLHEHLPKEEFFKFMGLTWLVRQRRNNFVFQHKILDEKIWTSWAMDLIFTHLEPHQKTSKTTAMKLNSAWIPPPHNYFLSNTDASLIAGQKGCGLSAVIRDPKGGLVVAATSFIPGCLSVLLAEANAVHLGIQLAIRWSITNAQVGSDSHSLIKALNSDTSYPTDWGQLVQDIKLLINKFQTLQFLFFTRSCNRVANSLAKWSRLTQKSEMWTDLLPNCAAAFLIANVPSVA